MQRGWVILTLVMFRTDGVGWYGAVLPRLLTGVVPDIQLSSWRDKYII